MNPLDFGLPKKAEAAPIGTASLLLLPALRHVADELKGKMVGARGFAPLLLFRKRILSPPRLRSSHAPKGLGIQCHGGCNLGVFDGGICFHPTARLQPYSPEWSVIRGPSIRFACATVTWQRATPLIRVSTNHRMVAQVGIAPTRPKARHFEGRMSTVPITGRNGPRDECCPRFLRMRTVGTSWYTTRGK